MAADDDTAVATGRTVCYDGRGGPVKDEVRNCFALRFDAAGQCSEHTEWYMRQP